MMNNGRVGNMFELPTISCNESWWATKTRCPPYRKKRKLDRFKYRNEKTEILNVYIDHPFFFYYVEVKGATPQK
mgnify:CR=1 FL=1